MKHIGRLGFSIILCNLFSVSLQSSGTELLLLMQAPSQEKTYHVLKDVLQDSFSDEHYREVAMTFRGSNYTPTRFGTKVNQCMNTLFKKPCRHEILHYFTFAYAKKLEVLRRLMQHESVDELIFDGVRKNCLTVTLGED